MRIALAWVIGILTTIASHVLIVELTELVGISRFEYSVDGANVEMSAMLLSLMAGVWIGHSVFAGNFRRDVTSSSRIGCEATVLFAFLQGIGGGLLMLLFSPKPGLFALLVNVLHLAIAAVCFYLARKHYKRYEEKWAD